MSTCVIDQQEDIFTRVVVAFLLQTKVMASSSSISSSSRSAATWQGYPEPSCLDELQYITPEELHKHIIASQEGEKTYADKLHILDVRQMDANVSAHILRTSSVLHRLN